MSKRHTKKGATPRYSKSELLASSRQYTADSYPDGYEPKQRKKY
jgi:hypothetical protein